MEQKKFVFMYGAHIRDEPARPDPTRPWRVSAAYFSNLLEDTNLKLSYNILTGLKLFYQILIELSLSIPKF